MTKAVLITGCSTGIGRAAAHLFASRGWGVIATMRRPEDAGDLAASGDCAWSRGQSKPEAIADVIFEAATDGSPRVRYVAGLDAIALLGRRASMTDEAYIEMTRDNFGLSG